ncbi:MAG: sodium:calcium antiporter [Erythrobacter sp.]
MLIPLLMSLAGLVGLFFGGELLVRGAVGLALKLGVSTLFTGLVIVGFATSMPEMAASIQAVIADSPGIAWGNIVGSNLANTLLILGVTALVLPITLSRAGARDAIIALAATLILAGLAFSQMAGVWIGAAMLIGILAYVVFSYLWPAPDDDDEEEEEGPSSFWAASLFFLAGLGILVFSGSILVDGSIQLARLWGVSEAVIGLTIIAVGTSLPELAASIVAALRGKSALAIGNVVGSNIYNILLIGGTTMVLAPEKLPADVGGVQMWLLIGSAVLLLGLLMFAKKIGRVLGAILTAGFIANVVFVFG